MPRSNGTSARYRFTVTSSQVRRLNRVPEASPLPRPVRVDHQLQLGAGALEHGAVRLRLPLLLNVSAARLSVRLSKCKLVQV